MTIEQPGPVRVISNPMQVILGQMQSLRADLTSETNVERAQVTLKSMDKILKDLSELQRDLGTIRKAAGEHVQHLRQAKPKGKPAEGTIRETNGKSYIFLDGSWAPYVAPER